MAESNAVSAEFVYSQRGVYAVYVTTDDNGVIIKKPTVSHNHVAPVGGMGNPSPQDGKRYDQQLSLAIPPWVGTMTRLVPTKLLGKQAHHAIIHGNAAYCV